MCSIYVSLPLNLKGGVFWPKILGEKGDKLELRVVFPQKEEMINLYQQFHHRQVGRPTLETTDLELYCPIL